MAYGKIAIIEKFNLNSGKYTLEKMKTKHKKHKILTTFGLGFLFETLIFINATHKKGDAISIATNIYGSNFGYDSWLI